jgi:hydrogenase nickel incorporation protein HypB
MSQRIAVVEKIMDANEQLAATNLARLNEAGVVGLNFMASPGAGKTSLIEQTIPGLKRPLSSGRH